MVAPNRCDGADPRRDRHRQGARRPRASTTRARGRDGAVRARQLRGAAGRRWSRASCSATSAARSPAPIASADGPLRAAPTAARCSSTRSASCRSSCRPSCCASLQERRGRARRRRRSRCKVDVRVVAATNRDLGDDGRGGRVPRGPLLPPERRPDRACRRCASGARTSPLLAEHFVAAVRRRIGQPLGASRPARWRARSATTGRATCASSRTCSSAR